MSGELTVRMLEEVVQHHLGARPSGPFEFRELVNQAGHHLVSLHEWRWLDGREVRLRPRAQIDIAGGTWTQATLRLTKTGAFTDYTRLEGDIVRVTEGTGATPGTYEVAAKVDANSITLATTIGAAANGQTDIEAVLPNDQIELPSDLDFQQIQAYGVTTGIAGEMRTTTPQTMLDLRRWSSMGQGVGFWALVRWVRSAGGGQAVKRLELFPPGSTTAEELVLFYRGGWLEPEDDDEVLCLPSHGWLNLLFVEILKAVVDGHEEPEGGSVSARLAPFGAKQGGRFLHPLMHPAVVRDGLIQPDWGPMESDFTWPRASVGRYDTPCDPITEVS